MKFRMPTAMYCISGDRTPINNFNTVFNSDFMTFRILITAVGAILFSCSTTLTENEQKGVDEALAFFGGYGQYSVGASASTEEGNRKFLALELSESEHLEKFKERKDIITSKIAYVVFTNLNDEEKADYTHLRGSVLFANGERFSVDYSMKELELVKKKLKFVETVVSNINSKEFDNLGTIINDKGAFRFDEGKVIADLEALDANFGTVKEYRLFGFKFSNAGGDKVLKISGVLLRENGNHELSVFVDPESKKDEAIKINLTM